LGHGILVLQDKSIEPGISIPGKKALDILALITLLSLAIFLATYLEQERYN